MTPEIEVVVGGSRRRVQLTACLDTGFDGDVCIPIHIGLTLGLELIGSEVVELADGSCRPEMVFKGYVVFLGKRRNVEVFLTESEEALVGTGLLGGCRLSVDIDTGKVRINRKPRRKRNPPTE
jgi:predicted aspartyl protease